jgi:hypothetical protein
LHSVDGICAVLFASSGEGGVIISVELFRLIVGAPRGNSTYPGHVNVRQPGVVYQCQLEGDGNCTSQLLDPAGK